jgi:hypothetical protein
MHETPEKGPGGDDHNLGQEAFPRGGFNPDHPIPIHDQVFYNTLMNRQIFLMFQYPSHRPLVVQSIGLGSDGLDCRSPPCIQPTELNPGPVDGLRHLAPKGVDFADHMPLGNPTDGGIA